MASTSHHRWLWMTLGVVLLDQATKYAIEKFTPEGYTRVVIPGLLDLVHRHNTGVAFGLLSDAEWPWLKAALVFFAFAAICVVGWLLLTGRGGGLRGQMGLALILGGAAGNALDRLMHGSVIDFVDFYFKNYHWPAFNVADSAIVVGAGLVILDLLTERTPSASPGSPEKSAEV